MVFIGRKTLRSERARMQRIDTFFLRSAEFLLALSTLFLVIAWVTERPFLIVDHLQVVGVHAVNEEQLRQLVTQESTQRHFKWIRKDNQVLFPTGAILAQVYRADPRIADATLSFVGPHTAQLSVREYTPHYLYCRIPMVPTVADEATPEIVDLSLGSTSPIATTDIVHEEPTEMEYEGKDCYFADQAGYVFASAPDYVGHPFLTILSATTTALSTLPSPVGTTLFDPELHAKIDRFIAELAPLSLKVHSIVLEEERDVEVRANVPWTIRWSTTRDPVESVRYLAVVLASLSEEQKQHTVHEIDLRFGSKIFYR